MLNQSDSVPTVSTLDFENNDDVIFIPKKELKVWKYIPIEFGNIKDGFSYSKIVIPDSSLYDFALLSSSVHRAWMKAHAAQNRSEYFYSVTMVFNDLKWPKVTALQKAKLQQLATEILKARSKYKDKSLSDLYNSTSMPEDLLQAHLNNDKEVLALYGLNSSMTDDNVASYLNHLEDDCFLDTSSSSCRV